MKRDYYFLYIILSLGLLVPVPGRLAYGIVLLFLLNIVLFAGVLFKQLIKIMKIEEFHSVLMAAFLIGICIIYKQLLILLSPVMALTLGFSIYIPAVSSFLLGYLGEQNDKTLKVEMLDSMTKSGKFSLYGFFFFFIRDVFGYGTITFPMLNDVFIVNVFNVGTGYMGSFFASIPGALVLTAVFVVFLNFIKSKFEIVQLVEDVNKIRENPDNEVEE